MGKIVPIAALAAASLLPAGAALAAPAQGGAEARPGIVVNGDRTVCRQVRRTATRMGQGRVCRSRAEWSAHPGGSASAGSYDDIGDAYFKGSGTFEPCPYDGGGSIQTPLGPR